MHLTQRIPNEKCLLAIRDKIHPDDHQRIKYGVSHIYMEEPKHEDNSFWSPSGLGILGWED
jgi:hypothetical protein